MYRPSGRFKRTEAERQDQLLSWNRDDVAFFRPRPIHMDLDTFCARHHHRPRHLFAFDPWERALRYIAQFPACQWR